MPKQTYREKKLVYYGMYNTQKLFYNQEESENSHVLNRFKVVLKPVSIIQETDHGKNKSLLFF